MLQDYLPVLLQIIVAMLFAGSTLLLIQRDCWQDRTANARQETWLTNAE